MVATFQGGVSQESAFQENGHGSHTISNNLAAEVPIHHFTACYWSNKSQGQLRFQGGKPILPLKEKDNKKSVAISTLYTILSKERPGIAT